MSPTRPGVTLEAAVRALVAHKASYYEEWAALGAVRIDPGASGPEGGSRSRSPPPPPRLRQYRERCRAALRPRGCARIFARR